MLCYDFPFCPPVSTIWQYHVTMYHYMASCNVMKQQNCHSIVCFIDACIKASGAIRRLDYYFEIACETNRRIMRLKSRTS